MKMFFVFILYLIPLYIILSIVRYLFHIRREKFRAYLRQKLNKDDKFAVVGFFHPYCNAGGGGEKVLWMAINAVQKEFSERAVCVLYTGDTEVSVEGIHRKTRDTFNFELSQPIEIVHLKYRWLVEDKHYPCFTLICQALGSVILGFEAIWRCVPDVYVDAMGYAFTFPTFRFLGRCLVACYIHYPFISTDMLDRVSQRCESYNNNSAIARSSTLSTGKWIYYRIIALLYGLVGRCAHLIMTNSTWTRDHIVKLWKAEERTVIVNPPCGAEDVDKGDEATDISEIREKQIVSISQFRPEKDHKLQLDSFNLFLRNTPAAKDFRLIMVGGCRNSEDHERVEKLKEYCTQLGLDEQVEFKVNASYDEWSKYRKTAMIGLHTMRDEHFGIGIVECMSAGLVMVAHNSAGPKMDILDDDCGFLATTCEEYADCLDRIVSMSESDRRAMVSKARLKAKQFSDQVFIQKFTNHLSTALVEQPDLFR